MDLSRTEEIKNLIVENLMLQTAAADIGNEQPLFGPNSLGLDSVDALQLVVALDKRYGLKISNPADAKKALQSVQAMASAVEEHLRQKPAPPNSAG